MIDRIYIFTIDEDRARPRQWACYGAMRAQDFPGDRIENFYGPSHLEFETYPELRAAAAAEFPFFAKFPAVSYPVMAQNWSYARLFAQIRERGEVSWWMHDDNFLPQKFALYEAAVGQAAADNPDWRCVNLCNMLDDARHSEYEKVGDHLYRGLMEACGDQNNIVTPEWCDWFLNLWPRDPRAFELVLLDRHSPQMRGYYTCDRFLCRQDFGTEVLGSMIHNNALLPLGQWSPVRDVDEADRHAYP